MTAYTQSVTQLESVSMQELEAIVHEVDPASIPSIESFLQRGENAWVCFEADVRSAAATALDRLRGPGGERYAELLRLCELEEQTRCQAFQATMMGEVAPSVYQATVRSILEKLLGRLETWAPEPSLYQAAAQCLSEYMSALNHHCEICAMPLRGSIGSLPAIAEGPPGDEAGMGSDLLDSEDAFDLSELGSEDAETLSMHSDTSGSRPPRRLVGFGRSASGNGLASGAAALAAVAAGAGADPEEMRKERRRESNKRASVKYRQKKSGSMQQVLADMQAVRQQVSALSSQNAVLTAENGLLKQQVAFLQSVLQPQLGALGAPPVAQPGLVPMASGSAGADARGSDPRAAAAAYPALAVPAGAAMPPSTALKISTPGAPFVPPFAPLSGPMGGLPTGAPRPLAPATASASTAASMCVDQPPFRAGAEISAAPRWVHSGGASTCGTTDCGVGCGVSEWLTADANLRL